MSAKHRGWLAIIGIPIVVILGISTPANAQCGNGATVDVELAVPAVNLKIRELRLQQLQSGLELSQAYAEFQKPHPPRAGDPSWADLRQGSGVVSSGCD